MVTNKKILPVPVKIWRLDDVLLEDTTPGVHVIEITREREEPNDLYAMPVKELRWAMENRQEI